MAIREFSPEGRPRAKIAFVGEEPSAADLNRFRERGFQCEPSTPDQLGNPAYAAQLDAVIWTQDGNKLNALPRQLGSVVPRLLDYDVRVYIRLAADKDQTDTPRKLVVNALLESTNPVANLRSDEWQTIPTNDRERERGFLLPCVYIFDTASSWVDIAALVCDRPASSSPKTDLVFDEKVLLDRFGPDGHNERVILLKRAFWNCSELRLTLLDGGMSGAPVFKAYASAEAGLVQRGSTGAYPHLFFVKIGPRKKIIDEYDKYCGHIFEYVPFHLGPRLRRDRCNLGSTLGILVGDFVDGSESLITCARGGRCGHAIANLFDKTLGGWRKQDYVDDKRTLSAFLEEKWQVEGQSQLIELPAVRIPLTQNLCADTNIEPLKEIFDELAKTAPKVAPAHGDMHATNVLVRHGDAILIDFEKLEQHYPLTYDPASLEGGLLVEGFIEDLKKGKLTLTELVQLIEPLYEESALQSGQTTFCRPGDPAEWFYNAVNQIRTLSWSAEQQPGQYALTLALCLIRKGCNPHADLQVNEPNMSRAIAFFFGQKILRSMAKAKARRPSKHKHQSGDAGQ
ncbi:phosphotransferase [Bradyrhizobium uaiense]|uniref:Ternary complex associated domain-containing protein n=1 Tax=Bradyrhizobium uaiense TaxID=2594946 RepID=A0A6P1BPI0_9BRAD|nr:phosphotransferase [Bradyrhizobium uaiense]NEV00094.1 hypothetical protein [Bradyrhizobium uaiense]